tara:strand:- start:334 stop:603 length:270 start_codon:yes stop_codon:yes gene_type:complete
MINILEEVGDIEKDIEDLTARLDDVDFEMGDDIGRMSYVRQLTAEFLQFLKVLTAELETQIEIPDSSEMMKKMLGRSERKRYYMSKFRL